MSLNITLLPSWEEILLRCFLHLQALGLICAYEESNFLLITRFYSGVKYILFEIVLVYIATISFHLMLPFYLYFLGDLEVLTLVI